MNIGIVTDEVSRNLREALDITREWGISHYELREGSESRTPYLTNDEIGLVEERLREGAIITALSPGVFKQPVENEAEIRNDLERKLPATLELADRFDCSTVIIFGFEKLKNDRASRLGVQRVFEQAASLAEQAGIVLAIENEPAFWIDKPSDSVGMIEEIDHPSLKLNWDPANLHWGGTRPTPDHVEMLAPYIRNLHVKDFTPTDVQIPWRPLGEGETPWSELLAALNEVTDSGILKLGQYTIETHWEPLIDGSRRSLERLLELFSEIGIKTFVGTTNAK
ncbi:MAG: sugar phosphate isomerase/epimerase [Rhodothermales bacterium]|nr:sugar phosphate isomerase/epimerase [Rhodothermales bacterium]